MTFVLQVCCVTVLQYSVLTVSSSRYKQHKTSREEAKETATEGTHSLCIADIHSCIACHILITQPKVATPKNKKRRQLVSFRTEALVYQHLLHVSCCILVLVIITFSILSTFLNVLNCYNALYTSADVSTPSSLRHGHHHSVPRRSRHHHLVPRRHHHHHLVPR